ncbi:hypothetical protein GGF31_002047 [Allomyces arbusculus]|nr:hypothetical protein GGF31_002047 [Allomyces arbusculus]
MVHRTRLLGPLAAAAVAVLALLVVAGTVAATARRSHPHRSHHHRHDLERYELSEIDAFLADLDAGHDVVPAWIRAAVDHESDGDKDKIPPYDPHPPHDRNPKHPSPPPRHPAPDPAPPAPIPAPKPKPIPPPRDPTPKPPKEPHEPRDPAPRPPPPPPDRELPPEIGGPGAHPPDRDVRAKWNVLQHPETRLLFVPPFLLLILWAAHHAGMWAYAAHQQRHRALVRTHLGGYEPVGGAGGHGTTRLGGSAAAVPRLGPGRMGAGGDSDSARRAPDLSRREEAEGEVSRLVREVRKGSSEPSELEREPYLQSSSAAAGGGTASGATGVRLPAPGGGVTHGSAASPRMSPGFGKGGQEILAMADGAATWDSAPILHPMRLPGTRSRVVTGGYGEEEPLLESEEAYATPAGTELEPLPEPMHATVPIQADPVMSIKNAQHVAMMTLLITLAEAVLGTLAATALPAPTRHAEVVGSRTRVLTLLLATWFTLAIGAAWAFAEGFFMSLYDLSKVRTVATLGLIACIVVHGVATERENRARLHDLPSPGLPPVVPGNETVPHLPPDVPSTPVPPGRDHDHGHDLAGPHRVVVLKGDAWAVPAAGLENVQQAESLGGVAVMAGTDGEDGAWSARLVRAG